MTTYPTDQITVADVIRTVRAPVTITYDHTTARPHWRVDIDDISALDNSLGMALFQAATMWQANRGRHEGAV